MALTGGQLGDIPGARFYFKFDNSSVASGGASSNIAVLRAPVNMKIHAAWRHVLNTNEATHGTASTSASYRRHTIVNGGTGGAGTVIMASLNQTASLAALGTRAFSTTANNTIASGNVFMIQQATVGGADDDGTVVQAGSYLIEYEIL